MDDTELTSTVGRMQSYFHRRCNRPATIREISEGTGLSFFSVRAILRKRNRGRFVRVRKPGIRDSELWQMVLTPASAPAPPADPAR